MSATLLPAHGCPFCGHDLDKIHRVQSTTACWVACSACGARGPSADDMDAAVRAWNRYPRTTRRLRNRPDADPITDLTFTRGVLMHPWTLPEGAPLPDLRPAVDAVLAEMLQPTGQMVAQPGMHMTYASYFRPRTNPTPREDL